MPLSGYLASVEWMGGWPLAFYVFGALGIIWSIVWWLIVFDSPASHPKISVQEKEYIQACLGPENIQSKVMTCIVDSLAVSWHPFGPGMFSVLSAQPSAHEKK